MKALFTLAFCIAINVAATAQTNPLDKKLEKATEYIRQDKLDEAEKYTEKLLEKNPSYGDGWDLLAKIRYMQYENAKATDGIFSNLKFTTKDENGKEIKDDTLTQKLAAMMSEIKPSEKALSKAVYTMRKATTQARDAWQSSAYLRILYVDVNIDSNVSKKALRYFHDAEQQFEEKNYNKAALLYKRALEEQPDFYKASLYLGDCYYALENYADAMTAFKASSEKFPFALEPAKYLADAYAKSGLYDKATEQCINTLTIYPDLTMMQKLENIVYLNGKELEIGWTPREVLPNRYVDTTVKNINEYKPDDDKNSKGPWAAYTAVYNKALPYCNSKGILAPNPLTSSRYLEVYSWEEMLKNSTDPSLEEARKMQKLNYLDCYVLVSCFHYDFYPQYRDFIANNKEKVVRYYKSFIKHRQ
jgi:tetratricopeptide (TPR) repeat protein